MNFERQLQIIRTSPDSQLDWYRRTYPDVARLNMDPAEHYLRYGAYLGRNPGTGFDTEFYLAAHPDVAASGLNPLVHYALFGKAEGRAKAPAYRSNMSARQAKSAVPSNTRRAREKIQSLKRKLRSFGFVDQAMEDFHALADQSEEPELAAVAAFEIALAAYREKTESGYETCLKFLDHALERAPGAFGTGKMAVIQALCLHGLGRFQEGQAFVRDAKCRAQVAHDLYLAEANFLDEPADKIACINRALACYGIPGLTVKPTEGLLYDRLEVAEKPTRQPVAEGPKVTVLIAAHNAQDTLPTTLRALQQQTWQNLEILVIDDASTDGTRDVIEDFARADSRIRGEALAVNGGAYVARNRGLDLATGEIVTLNDADDWSHPIKIETQLRHLLNDPELIACASQQARATEEMIFGRLNGYGHLVYLNTSSIMVRREAFRRLCGYWDPVRFSADTEMLKRLTAAAGKRALAQMETGPLSFQRQSGASITSDQHFGIEGFHYGARFAYLEAYQLHHAKADSLVYAPDPADRAFPAPYPMRSERVKSDARRHFDVIVASDFRMPDASTRACVEEVICQTRAGVSTAITQIYSYDLETDRLPLEAFDEAMDIRDLEVLTYGEKVSCDLLILRHPPVLEYRQRYIPDIAAGQVKVIVNQTPQSDYSGNGERCYSFTRSAENLRHYFGQDATWHPTGPLMRRTLTEHHAEELDSIHLSERDWPTIINIAEWGREPRRRGPANRLRIGRHGRDEPGKWPPTREELLAAYPAAVDIEVHVLGGAEVPARILGGLPWNWTVTPFGEKHPRDFLAEIDVFVHFPTLEWEEIFDHTILEAMAGGVPVILPEAWRGLFQDAALHATPETATEVARRLHADPAAYAEQAERARAYVAAEFSYDTHLARIAAAREATAV